MPAVDKETGRLFTDAGDDVRQSILDRITVPVGSRPHLQAYGSRLHQWYAISSPELQASIITALADEPRVLDVALLPGPGRLDIDITARGAFLRVSLEGVGA